MPVRLSLDFYDLGDIERLSKGLIKLLENKHLTS
jgi:hypothetical protein